MHLRPLTRFSPTLAAALGGLALMLFMALVNLPAQGQTPPSLPTPSLPTPSQAIPSMANEMTVAGEIKPPAEAPIWQLLINNPNTVNKKADGSAELSKTPLVSNANAAALMLRLQDPLMLPEAHQKLLKIGTPLNFTLTFTLKQSRWYAWDKEWVRVELPMRIGFDTLSENFWVSRLQQTLVYPNFELFSKNALQFEWGVLPILSLPQGNYQASLTLEFDRNTLPLTLQMDVRPNTKWQWVKNFPDINLTLPAPSP